MDQTEAGAAATIAGMLARDSAPIPPRDQLGRFMPPGTPTPESAAAAPTGAPEQLNLETPETPPPQEAPPVEEPPAEAPAEGEAPAEEAPAETTIETLDDLAKAMGVETGQLAAQLKVTGPSGEAIPLAQVLEAHRKAPELAAAENVLRQRAADLERREAEVTQAAQGRLQELQGALETMYSALVSQEEGINWEQLKIEDPVAWAVKRQELSDRQRVLEQGIAARNQEIARQRQAAEAAHAQKAQAEHQAVLAKMPQWRDPQVARTDMERIVAMLGSFGLDLAQWNQIIDHRMVLVAHAAAKQWELETKQVPLALKRVSTLPVIPRPGPRTEPIDKAKAEREALFDAHRKSHSIDSAAALVKTFLKPTAGR